MVFNTIGSVGAASGAENMTKLSVLSKNIIITMEHSKSH